MLVITKPVIDDRKFEVCCYFRVFVHPAYCFLNCCFFRPGKQIKTVQTHLLLYACTFYFCYEINVFSLAGYFVMFACGPHYNTVPVCRFQLLR